MTSSDVFFTASWIWLSEDVRSYNQAASFRKRFHLDRVPAKARLAFSADTVARIWINGHWLTDGPCRGWPHAYHYDVVDVADHLRPGENEIRAIVRYHGVGTFHQIPQQAGFILQLDVADVDGWRTIDKTDDTWRAAVYEPWKRWTPKVCIQMGPAEWIDARKPPSPEVSATVIASATGGPWGELRPRDVVQAERFNVPVPPPRAIRVVKRTPRLPWAVPVSQLCHPGVIATNIHTSRGLALATIVHSEKPAMLPVRSPGWIGYLNGRAVGETLELQAGANALLYFVRKFFDNTFEALFDEPSGTGFRLESAIGATSPWALVTLPEFDWLESDLCWLQPARPDRTEIETRYRVVHESNGVIATSSVAALREWTSTRGGKVPTPPEFAWEDPHPAFERREPVRDVEVASTDAFPITLSPQADGDIEIHIDLGDQYAGYYGIDLEAAEGTILDFFAVENVTNDGRIQHTTGARNGFRYVCYKGRQSHRSFLRRSGRHLFLTLRELGSPVTLHGISVIESRYPARVDGSFRCSDERLNRVWEASRRTMELSMDDVYIDSLYEQTLWVGDLQTEQLYGLWTFGARDISLRSLRLAAQSLDRLPMIGAQVPSSWQMLLSAWSFLWGIAVWDFYEYTGDRAALAELWPAVRKNLVAAETHLNPRGLFEASFWNLFDWAPIEQGHRCVLHNSMFMVGAIDAAIRCAAVLGHADDERILRQLRIRVVRGIESTFNADRGAYPDAIDDSGKSVGFSQHAQFLAILFDVAPHDRVLMLTKLLREPPKEIVLPGSPFALHFLYGTLEKLGLSEALVDSIRRDYEPILAANATTVWETLPRSGDAPAGWPTRSHCHGWSASPIYYLPRNVLGIRPTGVGGSAFDVRPSLGDLEWAEGSVATPHGPLHVRVERRDGRAHVTVRPPSDAVRVVVHAEEN